MLPSDHIMISLPLDTDGALVADLLSVLSRHGYATRVEASASGRGGRGRRLRIRGDVPGTEDNGED